MAGLRRKDGVYYFPRDRVSVTFIGQSNTAGQCVQDGVYWAPTAAVAAGEIRRRVDHTANAPRCWFKNEGSAGVTGATEPTWPTTNGATVVDGTVTWSARQLGAVQRSAFGPPSMDPVPPNGSLSVAPFGTGEQFGSYHPGVAGRVYQLTGVAITPINAAKSGTSIVADWCGIQAPSTVLAEGGSGFDPSGYIAAAIAAHSNVVHHDVTAKLVVLEWGNADSNVNRSASMYAAAHVNIGRYFLTRGYDVMIGLTFTQPGNAAWYDGNGATGIAQAIAQLQSEYPGRVFAGVNAHALVGGQMDWSDTAHADANTVMRIVEPMSQAIAGYLRAVGVV